MASDTVLSIRTSSDLKNKAKHIFAGYGLDVSSGVNMYLRDIVAGRTRPSSDIKYVEQKILEKWEKGIRANSKAPGFKSMDDLMAYLNS